MEFAAIGVIMLTIVLVFYLRMVDARMRLRKAADPVRDALAEADIFESVADDAAAMAVIETALQRYPDDPRLNARKTLLQARLTP